MVTYDVFDSGLFSSAILLIGTLIYDTADLYEIGVWTPDSPDRVKNTAWFCFGGAIAFVVASLSEVIWVTGWRCSKKPRKNRSVDGSSIHDPLMSKERDDVQSTAIMQSAQSFRDEIINSPGSAGVLLLDGRPVIRSARSTYGKLRTCTTITTISINSKDIPSFYLIRWNFWSAVFFLIPSLCYLAQFLIDPYTMYCPLFVKLLAELRLSDDEYYKITSDCSSWLFAFDSLINMMTWKSCIHIQGEWTCADWMLFRADIFFVIASFSGVYNIYDARKEIGILSNVLWTINAFLWVIGSSLAFQETRKLAKENNLAHTFLKPTQQYLMTR